MSTPIAGYFEQPRKALLAGVPTAVIHVQATAERSSTSACVFLILMCCVCAGVGRLCVCMCVCERESV